jgi:hypothetical protein
MPGLEYDVTGHILLSVDAQALDPDALRGHNLAAEVNLGLQGTAYTDTDRELALVAVVSQVNKQIAENPNPNLKSETEGERSYMYLTAADGVIQAVDQQAALICYHLRAKTPANWL